VRQGLRSSISPRADNVIRGFLALGLWTGRPGPAQVACLRASAWINFCSRSEISCTSGFWSLLNRFFLSGAVHHLSLFSYHVARGSSFLREQVTRPGICQTFPGLDSFTGVRTSPASPVSWILGARLHFPPNPSAQTSRRSDLVLRARGLPPLFPVFRFSGSDLLESHPSAGPSCRQRIFLSLLFSVPLLFAKFLPWPWVVLSKLISRLCVDSCRREPVLFLSYRIKKIEFFLVLFALAQWFLKHAHKITSEMYVRIWTDFWSDFYRHSLARVLASINMCFRCGS
jgi:hypothetical protein